MNDTDNVCMGLFLLALVFWMVTSQNFAVVPVADAIVVQGAESHRVEALLAQK